MIRILYDVITSEYNNLRNIELNRDTLGLNRRIIDKFRFTFTNDMSSLLPNEMATFVFNDDNSNNNNIADPRQNDDDDTQSLLVGGRRKRKTNKRKSHKRRGNRR